MLARIDARPPDGHPAGEKYRWWRIAQAESRDRRLAAEEPTHFLTVWCFWEYVDALVATGDLDPDTAATVKKWYADEMVRLHRAHQHVPNTERYRFHADIPLAEVLSNAAKRKQFHAAPRQQRTFVPRRRWSSSSGRAICGGGDDAGGDGAGGDDVVHAARPRLHSFCIKSSLTRDLLELADLRAEKAALETDIDAGIFDARRSRRLDAVVVHVEALSEAIQRAHAW